MLLAIDAGTTGVTAIVYDADGGRHGHSYSEFPSSYPQPGWVEQDPLAILETALRVSQAALQDAGQQATDVAIGITNQRETTIVWDEQGKPIAPAIVWQDRRTAMRCDQLADDAERIRHLTGLVTDPYFSATKLQWILDHTEGARAAARAGKLRFGTVDSWLAWNLVGEHVTDHTNASRTMLFDIHAGAWHPELLAIFDVPPDMLPDVVPSAHHVGEVSDGPLQGARLMAMVGDQQSALYGQGCLRPGETKTTYGTGCFLLQHTGDVAVDAGEGLLTTRAASTDGRPQFAVEGSVFVGGAAVQWLRDGLGIIESAPAINDLALLSDDDEVVVVPSFTGLGAPYWDPDARGAILGLRRDTDAAAIARATLRSIAQQTCDVIEAMESVTGRRLESLRVDGGAARSGPLLQMQADLLQCPVIRAGDVETTALGAAGLAAVADGQADGPLPMAQSATTTPRLDAAQAKRLRVKWRQAVTAVRTFRPRPG